MINQDKIPRLRISEQLLIVFFAAVLLPLCVTAFIVTNVNQQAVRRELKYSANITVDNTYKRLLNSIKARELLISYIADSLNYIKSKDQINKFLREIQITFPDVSKIDLVDKKSAEIPKNLEIYHKMGINTLSIYKKIPNSNKYAREVINLDKLKDEIFEYLIDDKRQVYITDSKKNILMSYNQDINVFRNALYYLPDKYAAGEPVLFGKLKNEPNVFLKLKEPDWSIIVITPKNLTQYGIIEARYKIILAMLVAAASIIIAGAWYSLSLNRNIKQLFKAISAIQKGNYRRKIRLIRQVFTPYEIIFLANEFNNMIQKIDDSYKELQQANRKLAKIDSLKSNLIDTVSHEFRTPLTCIKGYASRLLRSDINIDEETKIKSLKVIKQQTERLSRLVDDLLVIPEIESSLLNVYPAGVNIRDIFEGCISSVKHNQPRKINFSMPENPISVFADPDRLEQIIINLLDNAIKYSSEDSEININIFRENNRAVIKIRNECEPIPHDVLNTLFDKFTRIDDNLTRTTRGTGLGLYITKGLIKAMNGEISLSSSQGFEVRFTLPVS